MRTSKPVSTEKPVAIDLTAQNLSRPQVKIGFESTDTLDTIVGKLREGHEGQVRAGFLLGVVRSEKYFVTGVYVPTQNSTDKSTEVAKDALADAIAAGNVVGFVHYTHTMPVFDTVLGSRARAELGALQLPKVSLVVNSSGVKQFYQ